MQNSVGCYSPSEAACSSVSGVYFPFTLPNKEHFVALTLIKPPKWILSFEKTKTEEFHNLLPSNILIYKILIISILNSSVQIIMWFCLLLESWLMQYYKHSSRSRLTYFLRIKNTHQNTSISNIESMSLSFFVWKTYDLSYP